MRKIYLTVLFLSFCFSTAYAHPPKDVEIHYSDESQVLEVSMKHVVTDRKDHFIRKIKILKTGEDPKVLYYSKQKETRSVVKNISINLYEEESIVIKIYSQKGGITEKIYTVPKIVDIEINE